MDSQETSSYKMVAFRCPQDLLRRLDECAEICNISRTELLLDAIELFTAVCKNRGGHIVPPIRSSFAKPEIQYLTKRLEATLQNASRKDDSAE